MTLKISSRSISPFWRMFAFTLRKNLGVIIVLCIAALMYCPGSFISVILNTMVGVNSVDYTQIFATTIAVLAGGVTVLFNVINFTFMYKKSAGDVFFAFPLKRTELLLSRTLAGVVSTVIPMTVAYIAFSILVAFNSWLGSFALLAVCFLNTLIILLVCSAFSLIFIVCAGSMFDLGVSLIGVNLAVMLIGNIFTHTLSSTLIGYSDNYAHGILYNLSIPYFCYRGLDNGFGIIENGLSANNIEFYIRSVIYILSFGIIAILLNNYRKAEKGGTAYAYKFMYLICSMLAGICGGYIIGMMFGYEPYQFAYWVFMGLGAVLCSTVYGVVTRRGFKQVWRSVVMGGVAVSVSVIVAVIGITGGFGYADRVPDIDDVDTVWVIYKGENIEFNNPEKAIALHNEIVKKDAAQLDFHYWDNRVVFEYLLKNGKVVSRDFYIDVEPVEESLLEVYTDTKRIDKYIEMVKNDKYGFIMFNYDHGETYGTVTLNKTQTIEILEEYKKDLKNSDKDILTKNWKYRYEFGGGTEHSGTKDYYYFDLESYPEFVNTYKYLEENIIVDK